ncbi:acetyltransferase GNAT family protein [Asticcacaulis biprosthecium C19]|uniref:Acetyltransferase GNAT family protein n=1 Tax=Asticcacaulis biprosthecium C19 TaxID=715226 RepID=F4QTU4_9CAUL|nr:GNAT family N-acetyltransferase [Asticcacaulis biprosthecium]EGF89244.1 acetyltransferase GNAT family protein [Asticcacaulis biprosthecium C19]
MPLAVRRIAHATPDYDTMVALRRAILRTPLGLDFTADQLTAEAGDVHLAAFAGDELIGTVVLTPYKEATFKLRQMAVADSHRGRAVGTQLLMAAEHTARGEGATRILLAARVTARDFYARHGYEVEGEAYIEVTLPHVTMSKVLKSSDAA